MSELDEEDEEKSIIKYTGNYGGLTEESKHWDDLEELGKDTLLKLKIIKIKIYTGTIQDKKVIFGIGITFKNLFTGETLPCREHNGSQQFDDVKEFSIKGDEYLTDFHVRFTNEAEYITQIGFNTNKGNKILIGTEEGEDKTIESNGGENIIVGITGALNKKLDAIGVLYINKKEFIKKRCFALFMLNYLAKNDEQFKKEGEKNYDKLSDEYKYLWKTVTLPDASFSQVIKFCGI